MVLVAVIVLAATCAAGDLSGALAQDFFQELFGSFAQQNQPRLREARARHAPRHALRQWRRAARIAPAAASPVEPQRPRHALPQTQERNAVAAPPGGLQSYCVRDCDGYFFPVGVYTGSADTASHQRACSSLCPGASTSLFVLPTGSDKIEDAVAAHGRGSYARLAASLRRRADTEKDPSCACQSEAAQAPTNALYRDPTLRRGDAVMTDRGVRIFRGAGRFPYTDADFRPLSQTPDVPAGMRRKLAALDRAAMRGRAPERRAAGAPSEHRSQSGSGRRRRR
ncbi:DUF2865 domain-containing protein [Methylosinus sp. Sm6]|nr:DUF2865 domain-containing protein [Methylosinus sp. Sm6]